MRRDCLATAACAAVAFATTFCRLDATSAFAADDPPPAEKKEQKPQAEQPPQNRVVHMVLFSLKKNAEEEKLALQQLCQRRLSTQPGILFFGVGAVSEEGGALNDRDFDVALTIVFESQAALEAYDKSAEHRQFIKEARGNWKKMRVVDSTVEPRFVVKN